MSKNESDYIEDIIHSMEGSERAKPDPGLMERIHEQIYDKHSVIQLSQLRKYAAAAIFILALNASILIFLNQKAENESEVARVNTPHQDGLINSFQLYDS